MSEALPNVAVVVNEVTGNRLPGRHLGGRLPGNGWGEMQRLVLAQAAELCYPVPGMPGWCAVCRGPARRGSAYCFQCDLHGQCAGGGLADLVVPVALALKGGPHAKRLWQYKSIPGPRNRELDGTAASGEGLALDGYAGGPIAGMAGPKGWADDAMGRAGVAGHRDRGDEAASRAVAAAHAGRLLLALLLVFLRDHGRCGWQRAGITWPPTHLAVVPSARGRAGPHPLRALIGPYLSCNWTDLVARPDYQQARDLDPDRFAAAPVPGGRIVLLDDTWTTGASAQSAAMALRRAGARSVATVVLGRHINPEFESIRTPGTGPPHAFYLKGMPYLLESCAVHADQAVR